MNIPLVSIIIPTYNAVDLLPETVESALQQTYKNIEIIVIDDGSTDTTKALFDEFQQKGVHSYTIKNQGASNARNIGLSKSKGEYIQFLDADDILHPNKIELQVENMLLENADLSYTTWAHFSTDINRHSTFKFKDINFPKICTGKEMMISFGMQNWFMPVFCWLTHKSLIEKAGNWNIEITNNDDGEYFSRVLYNAKKVICINQILSYYRVLPTISLSNLNSVDKINSAYNSYQIIEELLQKTMNPVLLTYPRRLYYTQYLIIKKDYPKLAKRAAKSFDRIKGDFFLSRNKNRWSFITAFGLYYGLPLYEFLFKTVLKLKKIGVK
ncbi:glycosyltransferase family 2 protein [Tamlana haliotis]|uniref:Glycosyltransferase family 2 protein n=1 Tax=Pseudotamlana haliotis TaxID=2614804 RepID=A0A6N6MDL5_9FLAO|nr:glycosyltransferase family 2 protein [Tamlana haliotis]KAB1067022.1 glycosyltransferase family 2 protein [Tamlana haliotis]